MIESLTKYGYIRLGVVSPEMKIADVDFNTDKIIESINSAIKQKCQILLFPELSITGYSCGDLFFQDSLLKKAHNAVDKINRFLTGKKMVVIVGAPIPYHGKLFNCAVVMNNGEILGITPKTYLCNTNEYYEERWFSSELDRITDYIHWGGNELVSFGADILFKQREYPHSSFGLEICEDLWTITPPSNELCLSGAHLLFNLSASNEYLTKSEYRRDLVRMHSSKCLSVYALSTCGPNESTTDTVFSGHSIIAENGIVLNETDRFKFDTQIAYADIDIEKLNNERLKNNSFGGSKPSKNFRSSWFTLDDLKDKQLNRDIQQSPFVPSDSAIRTQVCEEIFQLQTTGLIKRVKHIKCKSLIIGISGGLDSTLALLVAIEAYKKTGIGLKNIIAVSMPGLGTTNRTRKNAEKLAKLMGVSFQTIPISKAVNQHFNDIGYNNSKPDIVYENAQARERTQILMDIANKQNGIVLGTGDLSEIALGWNTYNADHMSMYNVNSGVPKTLVKYIIRWLLEEKYQGEKSKVLNDIYNTPISPELLPAGKKGNIIQYTEKEIGPYELHDFFLYYMLRMNFSPGKIVFLTLNTFGNKYTKKEIIKWLKVFYTRFFDNQFKRSCMPDGVKVGSVALSPRADWRMPSDASSKLWLEEIEGINAQ